MNGFWETRGFVRPDFSELDEDAQRTRDFLLFDNQLTAWRQSAADCLSRSLRFSTFRGLVQYPG